jgi:hypothetical protein
MSYVKCIRLVVFIGFSSLFCAAIISAPRQSIGKNPEAEESKFVKPESIQGCYDLGTLSWKPDLKLGEDRKFITPPQRIQILAERGSVGFEKPSAACARLSQEYSHCFLLGIHGAADHRSRIHNWVQRAFHETRNRR